MDVIRLNSGLGHQAFSILLLIILYGLVEKLSEFSLSLIVLCDGWYTYLYRFNGQRIPTFRGTKVASNAKTANKGHLMLLHKLVVFTVSTESSQRRARATLNGSGFYLQRPFINKPLRAAWYFVFLMYECSRDHQFIESLIEIRIVLISDLFDEWALL